jgi:hypothetical protein
LPRRAQRSDIYLRQFNEALKELRVGRIEGFQPYPNFVRHLFGSAQDFIGMTGRRYARVEARILKLEERVQTIVDVRSGKRISHYLKQAEIFEALTFAGNEATNGFRAVRSVPIFICIN